jgi:hypothetical protein
MTHPGCQWVSVVSIGILFTSGISRCDSVRGAEREGKVRTSCEISASSFSYSVSDAITISIYDRYSHRLELLPVDSHGTQPYTA